MTDCPDVVGMELEHALALLETAGWKATLVPTGPPRGGINGVVRVLMATAMGDGTVELVIAKQGWDSFDGIPVNVIEIARPPCR